MVVHKAGVLVEGTGVVVRDHLDARHSGPARRGYDVEHELATDAASHPVRVDEQVFELYESSRIGDGGEPYDPAFDISGDPGAPLGDGHAGELERIGMCQQSATIAGVGQRRPAKDDLEGRHIAWHGVADLK